MAAATDPFVVAVQNGRQLALKISANSVYGFTGATVGMLPCLPVSSTVTSYGRHMIADTKAAVEARFTLAAGYPANAVVVCVARARKRLDNYICVWRSSLTPPHPPAPSPDVIQVR